jgi:hypothetical protein
VSDEGLDQELLIIGAVELAKKGSIGDFFALAQDDSRDPDFVRRVMSTLVVAGQRDAVESLITDPAVNFEVRRVAVATLMVAEEREPTSLWEDWGFAGSAKYLKEIRGEIEPLLQDNGSSEGTREFAEFLLSEAPDPAKALEIARDPSTDARLRIFALAFRYRRSVWI